MYDKYDIEEAVGEQTEPGNDGFLVHPGHARLFRTQERTVKRKCRWCGAQMRWANNRFMCTNLENSCDKP